MIQAGHRILGKATVNRGLPFKDIIQDKFAHTSLAELQIVTLINLGFVGLFIWDELSALNCSDLKFYTNYLVVFLEKRKDDQFREGSWV